MNKNIKVGIVGAGIQGVSNALFLQKKGFNVTIFDRDNPGAQAASYGNAGHFSPYASVPTYRPDVLADVPSMLLSSSGPLALKWNTFQNDSLVFKIYHEFNYKKNDAHCKKYAIKF